MWYDFSRSIALRAFVGSIMVGLMVSVGVVAWIVGMFIIYHYKVYLMDGGG